MKQPMSLRRMLAAAVAAAVPATMFGVAPATATADFEVTRIFGGTRYGTAAAIAEAAFPDGRDGVIIATGQDYADALAGSFLAGEATGFPILLVERDRVPEETAQALTDLGADTAIVLGGRAAIGDAVRAELDKTLELVPIAGGTRFDTAAMVAETGDSATVGEVDGLRTAFLASGFNFADALAAGPLAYSGRLPMLLTGPAGLAEPSKRALEGDLDIEQVVILGGENAISTTVEDEIEAMNIATRRVRGSDRYATAAAIADFAIAELGFADTHFDLAKGDEPGVPFADALAAAPLAGEEQAPLLLTNPKALSAPTRTWIETHAETVADAHIYGAGSAIDPGVEAAVVAAAKNVPGEVVRDDAEANTYTYVPEGSDSAETVTYTDEDSFFVDGAPATLGGFEAAIDPGDRVKYVSGNPATHSVTNVADAEINNRTIGNVSTDGDEFDFINDVTGDAVRSDVVYTDKTYKIGATDATVDQFEADLNEGDVVSISADGATFTLQNRQVVGEANQIESDANPVRFRIDVYGDDPAASSDSGETAGNDDKYEASESTQLPPTTSTDTFAGEATTFSEFQAELSEGDIVTYSRVGGVETFSLDNEPLRTVSGTIVENNPNIEPLPPSADDPPGNSEGDGGTVTVALADGSEATYQYSAGGTFVIDGLVATETEYEAAATPGDRIVFRPADEPAGQTQRIELTNVAAAEG